MSESGRNFDAFKQSTLDLIEATVRQMRTYSIGFPTLDRRTRDIASFIDLLSPSFVDAIRIDQEPDPEDEVSAYLDLLMAPAAFVGPTPEARHGRGLTFWAFVRAVQDLLTTSGQYGLNEVARNTGLFGHLASTLRTFRELEGLGASDETSGQVYWADFASEGLEPDLGADFAVVIGLGGGRYKVAFLQAKRVRHGEQAYVGHVVKSKNKPQVEILVEHERLHPMVRHPDEPPLSIYFRWCFYLFWHEVSEEKDILLPTVRSAYAVKETRDGDYAGSLEDGVEFSAFISLLLAAENSNVGYTVTVEEMSDLFDGHSPHALLLMDPPSNGPTPEEKATLLRSLGYQLASENSGRIAKLGQRMAPAPSATPSPGGRGF